mmetsp:Transcript_107989/g.348728  ORF Transcript_107989/g.348728 Transcript_107989/m.348728 type:complete len:248 (-) Transcript_107989:1276-2019(-)
MKGLLGRKGLGGGAGGGAGGGGRPLSCLLCMPHGCSFLPPRSESAYSTLHAVRCWASLVGLRLLGGRPPLIARPPAASAASGSGAGGGAGGSGAVGAAAEAEEEAPPEPRVKAPHRFASGAAHLLRSPRPTLRGCDPSSSESSPSACRCCCCRQGLLAKGSSFTWPPRSARGGLSDRKALRSTSAPLPLPLPLPLSFPFPFPFDPFSSLLTRSTMSPSMRPSMPPSPSAMQSSSSLLSAPPSPSESL